MKNELMKNKGNIQKNDEGLNKVNESDVMAEAELKEFEKEEAGVGDPQEIRDRETASLAHHRDLSSAKSRRAAGRLTRSKLLAKRPHSGGHWPGKKNWITSGKTSGRPPTLSAAFWKIPKKIGQHLEKIQQNSGKNCENFVNN